MRVVQLPPPPTGILPALREFWWHRSDIKGIPTLKQLRAMMRDGGVRPSIQSFNPTASYVPDVLREKAERHRGSRALFYTRSWEGCWVFWAVFPDGTEMPLWK